MSIDPGASPAWPTPPAPARTRRNDETLRAQLLEAMEALTHDR